MNVTKATARLLFILGLLSYTFIFLSVARRRPRLSEPKPNIAVLRRPIRRSKPSRTTNIPSIFPRQLQAGFRILNSTLLDVSNSAEHALRSTTCVLIGTSQPGYRYTQQWIEHYISAGIPFIHFTTGKLARNLAPHYGRIFALIAASKALPNVGTFVYTDIDTAIDFRKACSFTTYPMVRSWKAPIKEPFDTVLRTNWFVFNPHAQPSSNDTFVTFAPVRLLYAWLKHARDVRLQDQTVLNELYRDKPAIRDNIGLFQERNAAEKVTLGHCGSYMGEKKRDACIDRIFENT